MIKSIVNVGNTYFVTLFAHNNDNMENSYNICSQFFYSFYFLVALQLELILIYLGDGFLHPKLFFVYICSLFTDIICSLLLWLHIFFNVIVSLSGRRLEPAKHALLSFFWCLDYICFIYPFVSYNLVIPFLSISTCSSFCLSLSKFSTAFS